MDTGRMIASRVNARRALLGSRCLRSIQVDRRAASPVDPARLDAKLALRLLDGGQKQDSALDRAVEVGGRDRPQRELVFQEGERGRGGIFGRRRHCMAVRLARRRRGIVANDGGGVSARVRLQFVVASSSVATATRAAAYSERDRYRHRTIELIAWCSRQTWGGKISLMRQLMLFLIIAYILILSL